jgi:hypothetical protein
LGSGRWEAAWRDFESMANTVSCSSPMVSSLLERPPFSLKLIVDVGSGLTIVDSDILEIILTLLVRTEGADERPAPLTTEGVADLARLVRELAAHKAG